MVERAIMPNMSGDRADASAALLDQRTGFSEFFNFGGDYSRREREKRRKGGFGSTGEEVSSEARGRGRERARSSVDIPRRGLRILRGFAGLRKKGDEEDLTDRKKIVGSPGSGARIAENGRRVQRTAHKKQRHNAISLRQNHRDHAGAKVGEAKAINPNDAAAFEQMCRNPQTPYKTKAQMQAKISQIWMRW